MSEDENHLRKRVLMRAQHRGIKEMDIILGNYVQDNLSDFSKSEIDELEAFMEINDQRLYQMILGNEPVENGFEDLVAKIRNHIDFSNPSSEK